LASFGFFAQALQPFNRVASDESTRFASGIRRPRRCEGFFQNVFCFGSRNLRSRLQFRRRREIFLRSINAKSDNRRLAPFAHRAEFLAASMPGIFAPSCPPPPDCDSVTVETASGFCRQSNCCCRVDGHGRDSGLGRDSAVCHREDRPAHRARREDFLRYSSPTPFSKRVLKRVLRPFEAWRAFVGDSGAFAAFQIARPDCRCFGRFTKFSFQSSERESLRSRRNVLINADA